MRNAISGSARGWMSWSRGIGKEHARGQPTEYWFIDTQRRALDAAGQPQFRADEVLACLESVIDEKGLGFVGRVGVEEELGAGERGHRRAGPLGLDQDVGDGAGIHHAAASSANRTVTEPR